MKSAKLIVCGALAAAAGAFAAKPTKVISNASLPCNASTLFDRDTVYHLSGRVFVGQSAACPQELVIESGTTVKGLLGEQSNVSVLVITRWGNIKALGTATAPIVFTTVLDNEEDATDLGPFDRYMWGGIILLGEATISEDSAYVEGINNEPRGAYGGHNDADSSGELHYVSIRHGGKIIGNDNEINGLTFGGVGSKTVVDHIEVFANGDDGFEWFGGTVNAKYLVSAYGNDDGFDFDFGYRGKLQYGLNLYSNANPDPNGNQPIEGDGFAFPLNSGGAGAGPTDTTKYSKPRFSNLTLIGNGNTVPAGFTFVNDLAFRLRDGTGGDYNNMIIANFPQNLGRFELQGSLACDAVCKVNNGLLNFESNYIWNFGNWIGGALSDMLIGGNGAAEVDGNNNQYVNPQLNSMPSGASWRENSVDARPAPTSPAVTGAHTQMADPFFDAVTYAGAFSPTAPQWTDGWTAISQLGISKKYLTFQPGAGSTTLKYAKLYKPAYWDFVLTQSGLTGPINVNASEAYLDGNDVSTLFRTGIFPFPTILPSGERVYKALSQNGGVLGATGKHALRIKLVLQDGRIIDETGYWETAP